MDQPDFAETHKALVADWSIVPVPPEQESSGREALLLALKNRVRYLMQHDFNRLMTAMYLLDVSEARFNAAMAVSGADNAAAALAEVILDREIEKAAMRRKYRNTYNLEDGRE